MPHSVASRVRCNEKRAVARRVAKRAEMLIGHLPDLMWRLHLIHITKMEVKTPTVSFKVRVTPGNTIGVSRRVVANHAVSGVVIRLYRRALRGGNEYMDIYIPFVGPNYGITTLAWGVVSKPNFFTNFMVSYLDKMFVETAHSLLMARMKEELMAAVWHPRRVAAWLESGGWEAVENLMGMEPSD